ncbi:MAG: response regulator [Flavobacteriales bacterium]|nr:response regulator [Flavobacteriales bacterium]
MKTRILLVDDDPVYTMIMRKSLQMQNISAHCESFDNGLSAVEYFRERYNEDELNLIFLDINMPILDGWGFLDRIENFASPENVGVIVVSSSVNEKDVQRSKSSRLVIDFLIKPVLREHLEMLSVKINSRYSTTLFKTRRD